MKENNGISRRNFLNTASLLALGGTFMSFKTPGEIDGIGQDTGNKLWEDFSSDEELRIGKSKMAKIAMEIESGSCAEKVLLSTIRYFKKPDKLVSFASSFGGGIKKGDLCGMLTGAFMSIGFASERLIKDKEQRPDWVKAKTNELWAWWLERAPRHCEELSPLYANSDKTLHTAAFNHMLQRVTYKLEEMFVG